MLIWLAAWLVSRSNKKDDEAQSDRWGIFIGQAALTFFAIGLSFTHEER